jgi:hypothetical protein
MKTANIPFDSPYVITYCIDIIISLSRQLVESKSILDINNTKPIQKTFVACLIMLDLPHINTFLCGIDKPADQHIFSLKEVHVSQPKR